jgi:hypothetical protein
MNKVITATIAAASIFSFNAAAKVVPADNSLASQICAAAANGQNGKLKDLMTYENKNIRRALKNIQCNEKPLDQFIQDINSANVAKSLYPQIDKTGYIAKR